MRAARFRPFAFTALLVVVAAWHGWLLQSEPWRRGAARLAHPAALTVREIDAGARERTSQTLAATPVPPARAAAPTEPQHTTPAARASRPWRAPPRAEPAADPAPVAAWLPPADPAPLPEATPANADTAALPLYATHLPPPRAWTYRLSRGDQHGSATLVWQPDAAAGRYEATLAGEADGRGVLHWSSRGAIDAAGIAPERFVLREPRRGAQAANFERGLRRITYSGPPVVHVLPDGAQDRLSWLLQLAAVVAADPARHGADGAVVELFVVGARGDAGRWRFDARGAQPVALGDGTTIDAWAYVRAPLRMYDVRIEVWLAPAHAFMPVRLRVLPTGAGRPLELVLLEGP